MKLPLHRRDVLVRQSPDTRPLLSSNFLIMIGAAAAIIIGFLLMLGPGTSTEGFNADIFSTRRIIIGPTICFLGFIAMGVGIMYSRRDKRRTPDSVPPTASIDTAESATANPSDDNTIIQ